MGDHEMGGMMKEMGSMMKAAAERRLTARLTLNARAFRHAAGFPPSWAAGKPRSSRRMPA